MLILKNTKGIFFIISAVICFSCMNGVTKYLSEFYNVITLNMFRYWFFFLFLIVMNSNQNKSIINVSKSKNKLLQILRGSLLAIQMCFAHYCFLKLGLIETFYTGITGAFILSFIGPFFYVEVLGYDWFWIIIICLLGTSAHFFVIKAYQYSEASIIQPFNYLQLVFVSFIGVFILAHPLTNGQKYVKLFSIN